MHGFVEVDRGLLRLVQCEVADRAREQRSGLLRLKTVRCGEVIDRQLMLLLGLVKQTAAEQRLRVVGIEPDRLVEFGQRLLGFPGASQRLACRVWVWASLTLTSEVAFGAGVLSGAGESESRLIEQPHSAMAAASGAAARRKRENPHTGRRARSAIDEPLTGLTPHC